MSQYLESLDLGDVVDFRGPGGLLEYKGQGQIYSNLYTKSNIGCSSVCIADLCIQVCPSDYMWTHTPTQFLVFLKKIVPHQFQILQNLNKNKAQLSCVTLILATGQFAIQPEKKSPAETKTARSVGLIAGGTGES